MGPIATLTRRSSRSLRARLTLAAAGTILAAVVLFAVATVLIVDHELRDSLTTAFGSVRRRWPSSQSRRRPC